MGKVSSQLMRKRDLMSLNNKYKPKHKQTLILTQPRNHFMDYEFQAFVNNVWDPRWMHECHHHLGGSIYYSHDLEYNW